MIFDIITLPIIIDITEDIRKNLDEEKIGCGIFVDLQKAFDAVDHNILLTKLEHYRKQDAENDLFNSYLSDRRRFASTNGFNSILTMDFPKATYLDQPFFLIYINALNHAIKYCNVHHFPDDTKLLRFNSSTKKFNRIVNLHRNYLSAWLNAKKVSLNVQKNELVIFKQKRKILDHEMKIKLNRKRLYHTANVKNLGIKKLDENLNCHNHINALAAKLNRANALLFKIRNYVN